MAMNCQNCGQPIEESDWTTHNIKQLSVGLVHAHCPNKLLIANCPISMSVELLQKLFSPYGIITDTSINDTYGLIEYAENQSIKDAISAMDGFQMGTNKLSVQNMSLKQYQMEHSDSLLKNESKSNQYRHDKDTLLTWNAREIVSLLVPNAKVYKKVSKQWMKLLIQYKAEVIDFIYYSKANDNYSTDAFNYIDIPDYLKGLLTLKKDKSAEKYIKSEKRVSTLPSQPIIIVYGYIRKIEKKLNKKNKIIPSIIFQLCFDYYINKVTFYLFEQKSKLIQFDMSDRKKTQIISNRQFNLLELSNMRSCVCITDLIASDLPFLKYSMDSSASYYGIFGGDGDTHRFILREVATDRQCDYLSYTAPHHLHLENDGAMSQYIYCGKQYGVIVSDLDGLYQLKLQYINATNDYAFSPLCYKWSVWDHFGYLRMCYMRGLDRILAVQCVSSVNESYHSAPPGAIFDLNSNKWQLTNPLSYTENNELPYLYCDMTYNYNDRSSIYLVSGTGKLSQFDVNKNTWLYPFGALNCYADSNKNNKPILWLDNNNTNVLYHASLYEDHICNGYRIYVKYIDVRDHNKQWNVCQDWDIDSVDFMVSNADFSQATLFK